MITKENPKYFNLAGDCLSACLKSIRRYSVPTAEEEEKLFRKYKETKDPAIRDEIVLRNQRFVLANAKIYAKNEDEIADYINEGNIGLLTAIERFNPEEGFKFITYAVWYIKREMNQYYTTTNNLITRTNSAKIGGRLSKIKAKFYAEHGRDATSEEVSDILMEKFDIDVKDMSDTYDILYCPIEFQDDDEDNIESREYNKETAVFNEAEESMETVEKEKLIAKILELIPDDYKSIVEKYYGIGYEAPFSIESLCEMTCRTEAQIMSIIDKVISYIQQELKIKQAG